MRARRMSPSPDWLEDMLPLARTSCLYSAASMLFRSLSAASQSLASKPRLAVLVFVPLDGDLDRAAMGFVKPAVGELSLASRMESRAVAPAQAWTCEDRRKRVPV